MFAPGDVVLVDYPGAQGVKARPSVVVSTPLYLSTWPDFVGAVLTSHINIATDPTDYVLQDWAAAGLRVPSAFRAYFATMNQFAVYRVFGRLSDRDWAEVQARLRLAIAV